MTGRDDCVRLIAERLVEICAAHGRPPTDIDELDLRRNAGALAWTGRPHSPARVRASSMSDWRPPALKLNKINDIFDLWCSGDFPRRWSNILIL
jgi:hypothetical protein